MRDHLLLDAAALLGAVALHRRRLRQGRRADDAGGQGRGLDPAADPGLQPGAGRRWRWRRPFTGLGGPVYWPWRPGRGRLPGARRALAASGAGDAGRRGGPLRRQGERQAGAQPVRLLDPLSVRCCSPPCWSSGPRASSCRRRADDLPTPASPTSDGSGRAQARTAALAIAALARFRDPGLRRHHRADRRAVTAILTGAATGKRRLALICVAVFVGDERARLRRRAALSRLLPATGFAGTAQRARAAPTSVDAQQVTVSFDTNVRGLPWDFQPGRSRARPCEIGETGLAFFKVDQHARTSRSDRPRRPTTSRPDRRGPISQAAMLLLQRPDHPGAHDRASSRCSISSIPASRPTPTPRARHRSRLSYTFFPAPKPAPTPWRRGRGEAIA